MQRLLFSHIVAGFFVTLFLLGIIICVVYILYTLFNGTDKGGKTFMRFFTVKYYREIKDGGELKKKLRVYRLAPAAQKKSVPRKKTAKKPALKTAEKSRTPARTPTRAAARAPMPRTARPRSASTGKRVYFIDGKAVLEKPSEKAKIRL